MHDTWTDRLSEYLDDELTDGERLELESHLAACAECRHTLQDLRRVVATAQSLPPQPPQHDLWSGIADRIEQSSVVPIDARRRRISLTMPELAAASLLIATISGGTVWLLTNQSVESPPSPAAASVLTQPSGNSAGGDVVTNADRPGADAVSAISFGDAQYEAAVVDLEQALEAGRGRLDDTTISVVEQNLSIIDRAIAEARSALAADPSNGYLSGHLVEARRRKLDLLRRTATLMAEAN